MKVIFIAGYGPIIQDIDASRELYVKTLGLSLEEDDDHYFHAGDIDGAKHFALWPLTQAAVSCFDSEKWPDDIPVPTSWMEFDVEDVEAASKELDAAGYKPLITARKEPWGQIVTRFLSPEGILIGLTYTPAMREYE